MKKIFILLALAVVMGSLAGCAELAGQIDTDAILEQVETVAQQIDVEALVTDVIENIDWKQLEENAKKGYDALTEQFPALKSENIKAFLKNGGLDLLKSYVENGDADMQENARKLGQILKILNPELTDEVDSIIAE